MVVWYGIRYVCKGTPDWRFITLPTHWDTTEREENLAICMLSDFTKYSINDYIICLLKPNKPCESKLKPLRDKIHTSIFVVLSINNYNRHKKKMSLFNNLIIIMENSIKTSKIFGSQIMLVLKSTNENIRIIFIIVLHLPIEKIVACIIYFILKIYCT